MVVVVVVVVASVVVVAASIVVSVGYSFSVSDVADSHGCLGLSSLLFVYLFQVIVLYQSYLFLLIANGFIFII